MEVISVHVRCNKICLLYILIHLEVKIDNYFLCSYTMYIQHYIEQLYKYIL